MMLENIRKILAAVVVDWETMTWKDEVAAMLQLSDLVEEHLSEVAQMVHVGWSEWREIPARLTGTGAAEILRRCVAEGDWGSSMDWHKPYATGYEAGVEYLEKGSTKIKRIVLWEVA